MLGILGQLLKLVSGVFWKCQKTKKGGKALEVSTKKPLGHRQMSQGPSGEEGI